MMQQPMANLLPGKNRRHIKSRQVSLQQIKHGINIPLLHRPQSPSVCRLRQLILRNLITRFTPPRQPTKAHLIKLLPIQTPMKVPASANGRWQHDAGCVERLVDAVEVTAAGDFFDQYWGEALGTQLLVDAEEVNLGGWKGGGADAQGDGDAGDEGDEFLRLGGADADVPFWFPAGGEECPATCELTPVGVGLEGGGRCLPSEEGCRVVESEHSLLILNIVSVKQIKHLLQLLLARKIHSNPVETFW